MNRRALGFGLIEALLALALSLVLVLAVTQVFIAAKRTYLSQNAAANLQEDGRFILSKMLQEIRMVGLFGCLRSIIDASLDGTFSAQRAAPIRWDGANQRLSLISADIGSDGGTPTWTLITDCRSSAIAYSGAHSAPAGYQALALRRWSYRLRNQQLWMGTDSGQSVLADNVEAFDVSFGLAGSASDSAVSHYSSRPGDPARIRSVRLSLTLADPQQRVRSQTFSTVAALRNRLP
ncbi:pilus assembly protein PilW [Pseudomonas sp. MAFF 302046]|jgi:type IV pilus assembly protein PilW|uniref:Pilus assembly protein PilW n=1 Tax=Pseudomonas morbosilactucae TaxID=2938197 RepID=A0ABT0JK03_9PSED|nr:pilus assembly protein PilW [Pseudomonas morbosilactucae]MCK9816224.1 pilus assembly protein PilW [Pseudomonas morbosilactucae]